MKKSDLTTGMLVRFTGETGWRVVMKASPLAGDATVAYIVGFRDGDASDYTARKLSDYDDNMHYTDTTVATPSAYDIAEVATVNNFSAIFKAIANGESITAATTFTRVWIRGDESRAEEIKEQIKTLRAQITTLKTELETLSSGVDLVD